MKTIFFSCILDYSDGEQAWCSGEVILLLPRGPGSSSLCNYCRGKACPGKSFPRPRLAWELLTLGLSFFYTGSVLFLFLIILV
jgi:hypothetical protein